MANVKMSVHVRHLAMLHHMRINGYYIPTTNDQGLLVNRAIYLGHVEWVSLSKSARNFRLPPETKVLRLTQEGKDFVDDEAEASMAW